MVLVRVRDGSRSTLKSLDVCAIQAAIETYKHGGGRQDARIWALVPKHSFLLNLITLETAADAPE